MSQVILTTNKIELICYYTIIMGPNNFYLPSLKDFIPNKHTLPRETEFSN